MRLSTRAHDLASIKKRVLVVEDEMMVAMMIEDMLIDLGFDVVGPAMRLVNALQLAEIEPIDAAVLDVNLGSEKSFPVAEALRSRGIPFIFATGYGKLGVSDTFPNAIVLAKPFEVHRLQKALDDVGLSVSA